MTRKIIAESTTDSPKDLFETSSKDLVVGLMSLGHKPYRVEADGRIVYYQFNKNQVGPDANRLFTGEEILISYHKLISANAIWAMNLTRANELNSG